MNPISLYGIYSSKYKIMKQKENNPKHVLLLLEWYDYRIHKGVAKIAKDLGWLLYCPSKTIPNNVNILSNWDGDGCLALLATEKTIELFSKYEKPAIDLGLNNHDLPIDRVVTDNQQIGKLAADHFRDQGYREIFTISPEASLMHKERYDYLKKYVEADDGKVTIINNAGKTSHEAFGFDLIDSQIIEGLKSIAKQRNTTLENMSIAFFAYDDVMAAQLIRILSQYNVKIPENVAVLGINNDELINIGLNVSLSSIDCDLEGLGAKGAMELNKLMHKEIKSSGKIIRHPPKKLIARQSTDSYAVDNKLVAGALNWINCNFQKGIFAADVAKAFNVTQQGLQKAFNDHYIRTPGQEIRYRRAKAVANLLECTDATLNEIAKNCGYYSVDTLISGFKAVYNQTPGRYRQHITKEIGLDII